jgi:mycothiol system anti-sigma-R factor
MIKQMTFQGKSEKYDCAKIEKMAQLYLDNQLDDQQKKLFDEHLEYCLPCDKKIEFEKKLKEMIQVKLSNKDAVDNLRNKLSQIIGNLS